MFKKATNVAVWLLLLVALAAPTTMDRTVYGGLRVTDNAVATTIGASGVANKAQFTGFTVDQSSNGTAPVHAQDHIVIQQAGVYKITIVAAFNGNAANVYALEAWKNNGATQLPAIHIHRAMGTGNDVGVSAPSGYAALSVGDTVEVWVHNETAGNDMLVEDASLTIERLGP